jgi:exopolyphosphatase/guanosine-5'-triphosphate,3'-diphosphate pyrophosphatase
MFAAIDLGSNSFRLHIGAYDGQTMRVIRSARDPVRLGAGLDKKGNLTEEAMRTALASLRGFRELLSAYSLNAVRVVATNTMRIAKNAQAFLPEAEQAIGYPIEVISGEEEGRLIYMGVSSTVAARDERRLVVDIGGGSTEVILGAGQEIERVESFSIGTVKQSLLFFPDGRIDGASFDAAILSARSYFEDGAPPFHPRRWKRAYGSSGTIRAISDLIAKNAIGDGAVSRASLAALKERFIDRGQMSRINLVGARPDRVPALVGGLAILMALMQEFGIEEMIPIEAGLRMGVLWDLQLRATHHDRRDLSAREFLQRFRADETRAERVADMACALHAQLKPASDTYERYLYWSGLLHETGMIVSHTGYHKHAAYLIANADLPGFTTREQRIMSNLVLAQKGNLRKISDALAEPDFAKAVLALRLAVMFMHSRAEVDISELRLKMKGRIELDMPGGWMQKHPSASYWIAKEKEAWDEVGVSFTTRSAA